MVYFPLFNPYDLCLAYNSPPMSEGPPKPPLPGNLASLIELIAEEHVYGGGAHTVDLRVKKADPGLALERTRLTDEFRRELRPGEAPDQAFIRFRNRTLPLSTSPLMAVGHEFPTDLFVETRTGNLIPDIQAIAGWLSAGNIFVSPKDTFSPGGCELLRYVDGIYTDGGRAYINARVEMAARVRGAPVRSSTIEEIVRTVARRSLVERTTLNPSGFINLANGLLELATGRLLPHSPARRFTYKLPTSHDSLAECPQFQRFLAEVLPTPRHRREVQKLFGYCFAQGNPYQTAHAFVGGGNNGKSTLIGVLVALLGKENVAAETLQSLEQKFSAAKLFGKLLNAFADLPSNPLKQTSTFKTLTGGDQVRAELKFGAIFYFTNSAKLLFSANELPEVNDRTRAFWRRWQLIPFDQDFTGREDRHLLDRLLAELPGILNWALEGRQLLEKDGGFDSELSGEGLKAEWQRRSDTVGWFAKECLEADPRGWVSKEDLYEAYVTFCGVNKASSRTPEDVGKRLPNHFPNIRTEKRRLAPGEVQVRGWRGIRLKGEDPASPASPVSGGYPGGPVGAGESGETGHPILSPGEERTESQVRSATRLAFDEALQEERERS